MITLMLYLFTDDEAIYRYYPEGRDSYGIASINLHTGEFKIIQKAEFDHRIFQDMAYSRLTKYYKKGKYLDNDMVACY